MLAPVPTVSATLEPELPVKAVTPATSITATPHPTVCVQEQDSAGTVTEFCFIDWPDPTPSYANVEGNIHNLVLAVEEKWSSARPWLGQRAELHLASQPVEIILSGNPERVIDWLESRDAYINWISPANRPEYRLSAYVPVSLIGALSKQEGITRISDDYDEALKRPVLSVIPPGRDSTFFLYSNLGEPTDARIVVNYPEDDGNIAFGSCPGVENESREFGNGDFITITGCSLGISHIAIYQGNEKRRDYAVEVREWPDHIKLGPERSIMRVGQSHTFTLDKAAAIKPSERILMVINPYGEADFFAEGNLAFISCPGAEGDSLPIEEGGSVTITACREGTAYIELKVVTRSYEVVNSQGATMYIWD